jgi:hypothetical protein
MSARQDTLRLRLELLRMRAQIERTEIAVAVVDLKAGTRRLRQFAAAASSVGAATTGGSGGWLSQIVSAISKRPWLGGVVVGALRTARRHPWLALFAVGAVLIAARWQLHRSAPAQEPAAEPTAEPANADAPGPSAGEAGESAESGPARAAHSRGTD